MKKLKKQKKVRSEKLTDLTEKFLKGELSFPEEMTIEGYTLIKFNTEETKMTYKEQLQKWREARDITIESQKPGLLGNLLEETTEVARAKCLDEIVDGILDYSVYLANAIEEVDLDQELSTEELREVERKRSKHKDLDENALIVYKNFFLFKLMDGVKSASFVITKDLISMTHKNDISKEINMHVGYLNSLFRLIKSAVMIAGYDFDKAMEEVFKAINSRKGKWNYTLQKFEKDPDQIDRYEPNYENAKIK